VVPVPLAGSPLPVEVVSHSSVWSWLAPPLIAFASSVVLFAGTLFTLWRRNRAAAERLYAELAADRAQKAAELAAKRADQFRDEVAAILVERQSVVNAQANIGWAVFNSLSSDDDAQTVKWIIDADRRYKPVLIEMEKLVVRASLFTNQPEAITVGDQVLSFR